MRILCWPAPQPLSWQVSHTLLLPRTFRAYLTHWNLQASFSLVPAFPKLVVHWLNSLLGQGLFLALNHLLSSDLHFLSVILCQVLVICSWKSPPIPVPMILEALILLSREFPVHVLYHVAYINALPK